MNNVLVIGTNIDCIILNQLINGKLSFEKLQRVTNSKMKIDNLRDALCIARESGYKYEYCSHVNRKVWRESFDEDNLNKKDLPYSMIIATGSIRAYSDIGMTESRDVTDRLKEVARKQGIPLHLVESPFHYHQELTDNGIL